MRSTNRRRQQNPIILVAVLEGTVLLSGTARRRFGVTSGSRRETRAELAMKPAGRSREFIGAPGDTRDWGARSAVLLIRAREGEDRKRGGAAMFISPQDTTISCGSPSTRMVRPMTSAFPPCGFAGTLTDENTRSLPRILLAEESRPSAADAENGKEFAVVRRARTTSEGCPGSERLVSPSHTRHPNSLLSRWSSRSRPATSPCGLRRRAIDAVQSSL